MPTVIDTQNRTSDLDRELETARKSVSALEQEEAEQMVRRQAEYQTWIQNKADKFRLALETYLKVYQMIRDLEDTWRRQVFRGEECFCMRTDSAIRGVYGLWAAHSEIYEEKAKYLNRHGMSFTEELTRISSHKQEAIQSLRTWEPPTLSLAPSFRSAKLSADATARFREAFPDAG